MKPMSPIKIQIPRVNIPLPDIDIDLPNIDIDLHLNIGGDDNDSD
jgi:hypothetical protein